MEATGQGDRGEVSRQNLFETLPDARGFVRFNASGGKAVRVLHWYPNFLGGGGVANGVLGLAEAQAQLGAEVAIASATVDGQPLYERMRVSDRMRLLSWTPRWDLRLPGLRLRGLPAEAVGELKSFEPDVVHVHGEFNPDNIWAARIFDTPLILSPQGAFHPVALGKSRRIGKRLYINFARRTFYRRLQSFHALSPAEATHINALLGNVPTYCVPQGPSISVFPSNGPEPSIRKKGDSPIRFLFVGRLDIFTKGLDILLCAFSQTLMAMPAQELELVLVGPDWKGGRKRLKAQAERLSCAERVMFTGALPGAKVRSILETSDIYTHISRYEGLPKSIAEALLAGKPAILSSETDMVSYSEIKSLPHVKVVVPEAKAAAAAMIEIVRHHVEMQNQARAHLPQIRHFFAWDRVAKLHLERYEQLIDGTV